MIIDSVDAIAQDAPNSVWLTMLGGLNHLVGLKWVQPTVAQGVPRNWSALSAVTDARGRGLVRRLRQRPAARGA